MPTRCDNADALANEVLYILSDHARYDKKHLDDLRKLIIAWTAGVQPPVSAARREPVSAATLELDTKPDAN